MSGQEIVFYILTPHKIEAHEHSLSDFIADDISFAIQQQGTKIATDETCFDNLKKAYPTYHRYVIRVGKV